MPGFGRAGALTVLYKNKRTFSPLYIGNKAIILIMILDYMDERGLEMFTKKTGLMLMGLIVWLAIVLQGCGANDKSEAKPTTREYTDFGGRTVTIPTNPQKIVLLGDNPGDLLALGVKPIGNDWLSEPYVYKDELNGIADIGYPHNLEKIVELQPDLILQSGYGDDEDAKLYEEMAKIAPTAVFDRSGATFDRLRSIADIVGKTEEAEAWIKSYEAKAAGMWQRLGLKEGESATVYLSLAGDFYVMGKFSLTLSLYRPDGFAAPAKVQELIDKNELFAPISAEVLPDYAGDYIFMLSSPGSDDEKKAQELIDSAIWKSLPAVTNGQAYKADISWNASDPITMERFLDELPKLMGRQ